MENAHPDDRRLAERAAAGDDAAFAELVGRHRGPLVQFVARRTGRPTIAEDAVQEALLSAHRALRQGEPPRDVKAWLYTIAWRRALDLVRRERPSARVDGWSDPRTVQGVDAAFLESADFEQMLRHWRGLPRRQRYALAMRVLEGRSHEEIGTAFGVSADAAKSLVARSRRSLERATARRSRRERALLAFPAGLVERVRDSALFLTHHEPPVSLVTKVCAGACAAVLAGGGSAAVIVTPPAAHPIVADKPEARPHEKRGPRAPRRSPQRNAVPTPVSGPVPVATAVAGTTSRRPAGRRPQPTPVAVVRDGASGRPKGRTPMPLGVEDTEAQPRQVVPEEDAAAAVPTPDPTPPAAPAG